MQCAGMPHVGRPKLMLFANRKTTRRLRAKLRVASVRDRDRIRAVVLAMTGRFTHEEIAGRLRRSRSQVQKWIGAFRRGGVEGLLAKRPRPGRPSGMEDQELQRQIVRRRMDGKTATEVMLWLEERHGKRPALSTVYCWLRQLGVSPRAARRPPENGRGSR